MGFKKLRKERETYFRLLRQGVGNAEACRIVGVNDRTGREWRNGRPEGRKKPARVPVRWGRVPDSASSRYLCEADRIQPTQFGRAGQTPGPCPNGPTGLQSTFRPRWPTHD